MSEEYSHQPAVRRIMKGIISLAEECSYAQRKLLELRMGPERYVFATFHAPDTFADFLYRTSGMLPHEPSAEERARHKHVL